MISSLILKQMKKILFTKFFLVFFLFAFTFSCSSEKANDNSQEERVNNKTEEIKENTFVEREYELPTQIASRTDDMEFLWDKFYPIGWSNDGKFAYILEPVDEATGFYFITIAIQDLNSDKILWKFEYTEKDGIEDKDLAATWKEQYNEIKAKLNEHKIEQLADFELGKTEFDNDNNKFNLKVEAKKTESSDFAGMEVLEKFAIKLSTSTLGSKEIFSKKESESRLIEALVVGQLKSPHENKIAVLVSTEQIGYEGPPNVITFKIVGANLEKGFKK